MDICACSTKHYIQWIAQNGVSMPLFFNDKNQIRRNCFLKTLNWTTNLAYSLDGYLWAISALATEKLQVRCIMETHVITIKPPLQIVEVGNGCKPYSASIYIPAKSELMATLQSITRSQFFLEYNFNYTNVSNFLVWYKSDFAKLMNKEIKTLKAKVLKLPYHVYGVIWQRPWEYGWELPIFIISQTHFGFIDYCGHMCYSHRNNIHMVSKENFSHIFHGGKFN